MVHNFPKVSQHIPRSFGNGNFPIFPHLPGGFGWTDGWRIRGSQNTLTFDCNYTPEIWQNCTPNVAIHSLKLTVRTWKVTFPKGNKYSNHPFSCAMLVSGRVVERKMCNFPKHHVWYSIRPILRVLTIGSVHGIGVVKRYWASAQAPDSSSKWLVCKAPVSWVIAHFPKVQVVQVHGFSAVKSSTVEDQDYYFFGEGIPLLVGGFNPHVKNISKIQFGSFPQIPRDPITLSDDDWGV